MEQYTLVCGGKVLETITGSFKEACLVARQHSIKKDTGCSTRQNGVWYKNGSVVSVWSGSWDPEWQRCTVHHVSYICGFTF